MTDNYTEMLQKIQPHNDREANVDADT